MKRNEPSPRSTRTIPNVTDVVEATYNPEPAIEIKRIKTAPAIARTALAASDTFPFMMGRMANMIGNMAKDKPMGKASNPQNTLCFQLICQTRVNKSP